MPTYEYACGNCGEHVEVFQSFTDEPLTTCPNCGGPLRKVFGAVGIVLKGSGFYRNDSRSGGGRGRTEAKKEHSGDAATSTSSSGTDASSSGPAATSTTSTDSASAPAKAAAAAG